MRKIPSNLCKYFRPQGDGAYSPFLKYRLCRVTSFRRVLYGKGLGKGNLTAQKPYKHYLGQVIKVDVKRDESA